MSEPNAVGSRLRRDLIKHEAAERIAGTIVEMVSGFGGRTVTELRSRALKWPGYNAVDVEPAAALEAARELERAARAAQVSYIRLAREAGRSWYEIGQALDLHWKAVVNKEAIDDEAYAYALRDDPRPGWRTFGWTCPACRELISDKGPWPELPEREEGHQADCPRRTAELAAWQGYRAGPAEEQAGE